MNRFGASQLMSFTNAEQGEISVCETFSFALDMSVPCEAPERNAIQLTSLTANTSFAGFIDLTDHVIGQTPLDPGASFIVTLEGTIDASSKQRYELVYNVEGMSTTGDTCVGTETMSFLAGSLQFGGAKN